jgi:hypothetical protein
MIERTTKKPYQYVRYKITMQKYPQGDVREKIEKNTSK